jgi:DNA repair exonuclease SbcCD ATPase subunit
MPDLREQRDDVLRNIESVQRAAKSNRQRMRELKTEIDLRTYDFLVTEKVESGLKEKITSAMEKNGALESMVNDLQKDENHLRMKITAMNVERDQRVSGLDVVKGWNGKMEREPPGTDERPINYCFFSFPIQARDLIRVHAKYRRLQEDIRVKELTILDNAKKHNESIQRMREFAGLYEVVKHERNKYVGHLKLLAAVILPDHQNLEY